MELSSWVTRATARLAWNGMIDRMRVDPVAAPVAKALERTLAQRVSDDAVSWMDRIEKKRQQLWRVADRVEIDDLGAGGQEGARADDGVARREINLGAFYKASRLDRLSSRFLFELVRELRPQSCIELGTCTGLSAANQAAALELNGAGRLITIEGASSLAERATSTLQELQLSRAVVRCGSFDAVLPDACAELRTVDYVFNDGHHLEEPTVRYFEMFLPFLADDATIILDDINWSQGMRRAWRRLSRHPRVAVSVDLFRMGVLRMQPDADPNGVSRHYRWTSR